MGEFLVEVYNHEPALVSMVHQQCGRQIPDLRGYQLHPNRPTARTNGSSITAGTAAGTAAVRVGTAAARAAARAGNGVGALQFIKQHDAGAKSRTRHHSPPTRSVSPGMSSCYGYPYHKSGPGHLLQGVSQSVYGWGCSQFVENATGPGDGAWCSVDLGERWLLAPDYYKLRHGGCDGNFRLNNWELQSSNDGVDWTVLTAHVEDDSLPDHGFSVAGWPINPVHADAHAERALCADEDGGECADVVDGDNGGRAGCPDSDAAHGHIGQSFRHFRIFLTGPCSSSYNNIFCAGIELYGVLSHSGADSDRSNGTLPAWTPKDAR